MTKLSEKLLILGNRAIKKAQENGWDFSGEDFSKSDGWEILKTVGKVAETIAFGGPSVLSTILAFKNKK